MAAMDESGNEPLTSAAKENEADRLVMYKTKMIQFLGRSTPIVLQNDNGPCPLLAICNVLLLRNAIRLSPDTYEVSQDQLLALVADRLLESNSNVKTEDEAYVSNQQQNISDAIDLLPRLATGIDVNVHFRKINDFEFTRECAIFDLLDIGLYHGWIVDPEDRDTAAAIGSKSYNALAGELVALETRNIESEKSLPEEDCIDFVAATAAVLGIPHPSLSRGKSFDDSPGKIVHEKVARRSDLEEEAELARALKMSSLDVPAPVSTDVPAPISTCLSPDGALINLSPDLNERAHLEAPASVMQLEPLVRNAVDEHSHQSDMFLSHALEHNNLNLKVDGAFAGDREENDMNPKNACGNQFDQPMSEHVGLSFTSAQVVGAEIFLEKEDKSLLTLANDGTCTASICKSEDNTIETNDSALRISTENSPSIETSFRFGDNPILSDVTTFASHRVPNVDLISSHRRDNQTEVCEDVSPSLEGSEPIYEGEECIIDSGHHSYGDREPMYEGEAILAEQTEQSGADTVHTHSCTEAAACSGVYITPRDGQVIRSFLKSNASQLTIYGLFCLQEGLNERKLCVFFRNNHFSTMFKFNKELYLLVTDQGYINQPDLVWEKLNEVNGDTVFMTGDFKVFKVESEVGDKWDQQNAMTSTADYLSTIKGSSVGSTTVNSDLQLAIALQEQEFEQQQQPQPRPQQVQSSQQPPGSSRSRLVVGPQVPRAAPQTQRKQDSKSSEKCVVM